MNLFKKSAVVSFSIMLSRGAGMVRDIAMAAVLGSGASADIFFVALRIPNFFRRLFAEGSFSQAFMPVLQYYNHLSAEAYYVFIRQALSWLILVVGVFVVVGVLFADKLLWLYASGIYYSEGRELAVAMLRISLPYLFLISIVVFFSTFANSRAHFFVPSVILVIFNVSLIVGLLMIREGLGGIRILAFAINTAALLQIIILFLYNRKAFGIWLLPTLPRKNEGVRRMLKTIFPTLLSTSVVQIDLLISTQIASHLAQGSISYLSYADRLMSLPVGVVASAVGTVVLPKLSKDVLRQSDRHYNQTVSWGLIAVLVIGLPAAVSLFLLSMPFSASLFGYGSTRLHDLLGISAALEMYSLGIPAMMAMKVLTAVVFSREKTIYALYAAFLSFAVNIGVALLLMRSMGHVGLALAGALAFIANALFILAVAVFRLGYRPSSKFYQAFFRLLPALLALSALLFVCRIYLNPLFLDAFKEGALLPRISLLFGEGALAFLLYILALYLAKFPFRWLFFGVDREKNLPKKTPALTS